MTAKLLALAERIRYPPVGGPSRAGFHYAGILAIACAQRGAII